jgi:Putative Actinobacterial Holin-X, holin superfamily III
MPINEMNGRTLAGVVAELKDELKDFVQTRVAMLQSEMRDKLSSLKTAAPMIVIGLVLLGTAWLLITGAIVAAIYVAFEGNPFAAAIALVIVGVLYALAGGAAVAFAWREIRQGGLAPRRTIRVLKDDQLWIRNEARVQL